MKCYSKSTYQKQLLRSDSLIHLIVRFRTETHLYFILPLCMSRKEEGTTTGKKGNVDEKKEKIKGILRSFGSIHISAFHGSTGSHIL